MWLKVIIGVFFLLMFIMVVFTVAIWQLRPNKLWQKSRVVRQREELLKAITAGKPAKLYTLIEVKAATNGFAKDRLLGVGAFGEVYKGVLKDGTLLAVKSAKVGNIKSNEQVLNEVGILSQVNHKNLVRLLGCCIEAKQPLMIYEYISNGTLFEHLHGKYPEFLTWETRLKIASQTADALAYLHSSAQIPIYHRDVKSTNILLDGESNAKVSDFGLSRLAQPGLSHVSTCAQGTVGYLDPEYYRNYQLTDKSDVYSFGVVLLELLTTQKAVDFSRDEEDVNLAMFVMQKIEKGLGALEVVDHRLHVVCESSHKMKVIRSIEMVLDLALNCLKEKKGERPGMREVAQQLEYVNATTLLA